MKRRVFGMVYAYALGYVVGHIGEQAGLETIFIEREDEQRPMGYSRAEVNGEDHEICMLDYGLGYVVGHVSEESKCDESSEKKNVRIIYMDGYFENYADMEKGEGLAKDSAFGTTAGTEIFDIEAEFKESVYSGSHFVVFSDTNIKSIDYFENYADK